MPENLTIALQITVIGMGLVFGAILLLWLVMSLLVLFTAGHDRTEETASVERDRKQRAALAAVSVALAHHDRTAPRLFPLPPTAFVSAWQAVSRANHLRQRGRTR
jgi:hypothetical protein